MNAAYEEYQRALDEDWSEEHPFLAWSGLADGAEMNWSGSVKDAYNEWSVLKDATADAEAEFNRVTDTIRECYEEMGYSEEEIDSMMSELALASASATEASEVYEQQKEVLESTSDGYEEAGNIIQGYSAKIEELCTKYDEAYSAALQSVQGQYDLWTEVDDVAAMSSQSIKDALQSQIDYWNSYNENLASLSARTDEIEGLSDMLAQLSDGSEESAAMLAGMESMNDADLSAVVQQYNNLQTAQSDTASSMADLETDFSESLTKIQSDMETAVGNLNLSDEAKANAKSTMDAYVQEIQNGVAKAQKAIDSLSFSNTTLKGGGYHAYAEGTVDAEPGLALVGEEGPELVNFGGGEVVYTADETEKILAKDTVSNDFYVAPEQNSEVPESGNKTVTFRVEGAGEMKVMGNGVSKEDVVSLLIENVKDALMGVIQQEIEEEGDMSYEF
jgi:ABC-type transporter Mla subunit MlaD